MLKTCIEIINKFKKSLSSDDPYNSEDGGYNYLGRMNVFLGELRSEGIKVVEDENMEEFEYIEFKTAKQAEKFYNNCKWLNGMDSHWFSCEVEIKLQGKKVIFEGGDW